MLEALSKTNPTSLVLSRDLAAKTIMHGQRKDPLLYAPADSGATGRSAHRDDEGDKEDPFRSLLRELSRLFDMQHHSFMLQDALGTLGLRRRRLS